MEAVLALNKRARRGSLFEKKEGKNRKTLFTAGLGLKRGHLLKFYEALLFHYFVLRVCISKG